MLLIRPRRLQSATVLALSLIVAAPVSAQLEEVIVTARKREESIMKIPVVATTLGRERIEQFGLDSVNGISDQVPGLNVGNQVLASGVQVTLRGVGTSTLNPAVDQSVALNVDGMQMTQGYAYRMAMFDMGRVEVLKGPQALFYGKASPAGVISITTADPGDELELLLRGGYEFETEEKMTELVLSGPLTDTLGARLALKYADSDGYFTNTAEPGYDPLPELLGDPALGGRTPDSRDFNANEYWMARATALWEPTDVFSARFKLNYAHDETPNNGGLGQLSSCPDGTDGLFLNFIGGSENCKVDDKTNVISLNPDFYPNVKNGGRPFSDAEQLFTTLEWNYEVAEDLTLTSVTGYYDIDIETMINGTATTQFGPAFAANNDMTREDLTQELRLTSDYDGALNFMLGAFYQDSTTEFLVDLPFNQIIAGAQALDLPTLGRALHTVDGEAWSLFGQVLWNITPELELGAGVRWTDEERTHTVIDSTAAVFGVPPFKVNLAEPEISSDDFSPELSLTYTPTDDLTLFASLKRAFKSGSFDVAGLPGDGEKTSFDDEKVTGGEAGLKARMAGSRVLFNAAAYYYEFSDLQVERSDFDAKTGRFLTHTINAASADVYGIDMDIAWTPEALEGMTLYAAGNWNRAEYADFDNAACSGGQTIAEGCNLNYSPNANGGAGGYIAQDLGGESLLRAPEWAANAGFDYRVPVFGDMLLALGANASYASKYLANPLARDDMWQDAYTKVSASIGLSGRDEAWEVLLIGDNLTDELVCGSLGEADYANAGLFGDIVTGAETAGASGVTELACITDPGRTVWLKLTLRPTAWLGG
ncbi:TonB-dependent receptor [Mangrovimicrobium sediminis]|uniref:TonB-dependent receptor n=1 Tax=Mangrovimicrobium sediminis TaxID=2562682 RepID=A0A4Z0LW48_9GAMM|nr:TonB-dependent receptor [Haliea sp. SAOS-164]TGD71368.1 TonB-dependent receptor [Haliea sp. SAOS-164]